MTFLLHWQLKTVLSTTETKNFNFQFLKMSSNLTDFVGSLDGLRRKPAKFICINDDTDPNRPADNAKVESILIDYMEVRSALSVALTSALYGSTVGSQFNNALGFPKKPRFIVNLRPVYV